MKKIFAYTLAMTIAAPLSAQDTFTNEMMINTSDVIGTSRYVSMGGAMGALGAEISAINNNPASIGLFRRSDVSLTMGAQIQGATPHSGDQRARYTFDQAGFVAAFRNEIGFVNVALNLQKKANYGNSFFTSSNALNGFSQAAQLAALYGELNTSSYSLLYQANKANLYDLPDNVALRSTGFDFNRNTKGNLYGLDLNISGNLHDRLFLGATFGFDFLNYRTSQCYVEYRDGSDGRVQDYDIVSNQDVSGVGFNFKVGAIARPIEDNPLRIGIAIETPTFYRLHQEDSHYSIASKWKYSYYDKVTDTSYSEYLSNQGAYDIYDSPDGNYLEFNVYSPWKFRAAIASTYETFIAWDVEYEYSLNNRTRMGYPDNHYGRDQSTTMDSDKAMNSLTQDMLRGVHNVRVGLEVKPIDNLALRAGYNFYSSPMKNGARRCQSRESIEYILGTDYINLSAANIFTFGVGYRGKHVYADLAYKYRSQSGDFYPFEDSYQANGASEAQFQTPDGGVVTGTLQPTKLNLDRHNITFTLGYRF